MIRFDADTWSLRHPRSWEASYDDVCATFVGPDDIGALQISSIRKQMGDATDADLLAMATRHGDSADVRPATLGRFDGYTTRREKDGLAWTWWWVRRSSLVLVVTYNCDPAHDGEEVDAVNEILSTLDFHGYHDAGGSAPASDPPENGRPTTMKMWKRRESEMEPMRCSFCNMSQRDVRKLVAAPSAFICDRCIRICVDIVTEDQETGRAGRNADTREGSCLLCGNTVPPEGLIPVSLWGKVCPRCAVDVRDALLAWQPDHDGASG